MIGIRGGDGGKLDLARDFVVLRMNNRTRESRKRETRNKWLVLVKCRSWKYQRAILMVLVCYFSLITL